MDHQIQIILFLATAASMTSFVATTAAREMRATGHAGDERP